MNWKIKKSALQVFSSTEMSNVCAWEAEGEAGKLVANRIDD